MIQFGQKYGKRDDFDIEMVHFPFLDGDGPSYGVYISQLIYFARASSHLMTSIIVTNS